ncbi:hypothetical protein TUSST3_13330 [Streptomyces sp. TUS-ST3]|nr:hypothetical protein TUSST3_13330 [Streptomyces sp. TUS-ST3]
MADPALAPQSGVDPLLQAGGGLDQQSEVVHMGAVRRAGGLVSAPGRAIHCPHPLVPPVRVRTAVAVYCGITYRHLNY